MFEATGPELGRAAFMNTLVTSEGFDNGIYSRSSSRSTTTSAARAPTCSTPTARPTQAVQDGRAVRLRGLRGGLTRERTAASGLVIGIAIAVVLIEILVLMDQEQSIVIGIVSGSAYGLVALGLVLIYKRAACSTSRRASSAARPSARCTC